MIESSATPDEASHPASMAQEGCTRDAALQHFFDEFVPDDDESDTTEALKVFKGIIVMRLIKSDPQPARVGDLDNLFIGSLGSAYNQPALDAAGITHVLTVGCNIRMRYPEVYRYKVVKVKDAPTEDLSQHFMACSDYIEEALSQGGKVLVHCFMGRSRSSAVICAYLIRRRGCTLSEALRLLRQNRPQAQPNPGFTAQLKEWERSVLLPPATSAASPSQAVVGGNHKEVTGSSSTTKPGVRAKEASEEGDGDTRQAKKAALSPVLPPPPPSAAAAAATRSAGSEGEEGEEQEAVAAPTATTTTNY